MELTSLRTFKAVVDEGGIRGASEQLHTVQSNITSRIQRLEEELQCALFQRQGRRLVLTASGETLYGYASQMLQLARQAETAVRLSARHYRLRIGTPEPFAAVHLPRALQSLRRQHPEIQPDLHIATSTELTAAVLDGQLDCAFVGIEVTHPELIARPAVREQMVRITSADNPDIPVLILRADGCAYRERALRWQSRNGRGSEERLEMGTVDGLLGCVAAGLGYSVISREMVINSRYEHSLNLTSLESAETVMEIVLIYRTDAVPLAGIEALSALFAPTEPGTEG